MKQTEKTYKQKYLELQFAAQEFLKLHDELFEEKVLKLSRKANKNIHRVLNLAMAETQIRELCGLDTRFVHSEGSIYDDIKYYLQTLVDVMASDAITVDGQILIDEGLEEPICECKIIEDRVFEFLGIKTKMEEAKE